MEGLVKVTIKSTLPLFRKGIEAERVELATFNENGFEVMVQKGLYKTGDLVWLIEPDYCLGEEDIFQDFIRPGGDESKSYLGRIEGVPRRVRAKKFNFNKEGSSEVIYSNGILLPYELIDENKPPQIFKYIAPEGKVEGFKRGKSAEFPQGIYKTDEKNILNSLGILTFPVTLIGTEKVDGSSITIGIKEGEGFICSRNISKPLTYNKCVGVRKKTGLEKILFWRKVDLRVWEEVENEDDFVKYGKPLLEKLESTGISNIILRGELNGKSFKGSGNINNPGNALENNVVVFGLDFIHHDSGVAVKADYIDYIVFLDSLGIPRVKQVFIKTFNSMKEVIDECNRYFSSNLIEGIVVRSLDSTFSAKVMNLEYDSKK